MKRRLLIFIFALFQVFTLMIYGCGKAPAQPHPLNLSPKTYSNSIPILNINVGGVTIPDRDSPNYSNYADCNFLYSHNSNEILDSEAKIRIRGTSSRYFAKKGYKLKLSNKESLAELPANKKYNLLASYPDPCKLRDYLALSISYTMNTHSNRYAPKPVLTQLNIDDENHGLYFLTDDIATGNGRIPLAEYNETDTQIPFLLEMDTIAYKEGTLGKNYFALGSTNVFDYDGDGSTALLYKLDTPEEVTFTQFDYIQAYITNCRQSLVNKNLEEFSNFVDINSFIDYFLLGELFRNTDMAGRSVYMYKPSVDGKLIFGPSWDFDYSCSRPWKTAPNTDYTLTNAKDRFIDYDWWKLFLSIPESQELITNRYSNYLRTIFNYEIEEAKLFYNFYQDHIKEDAEIWYSSNTSNTDALVEDNFKWTCEYFTARMKMMDNLFYKI